MAEEHDITRSDPCRRCERVTVGRTEWYRLTKAARRWAATQGLRRRSGRGLCAACHQYLSTHGGLEDYDLTRQQVPAELVLEDYQLVRPSLLDRPVAERLQVAADRIGVGTRVLEKALEQAGVAA